jgi:hypothetical protein
MMGYNNHPAGLAHNLLERVKVFHQRVGDKGQKYKGIMGFEFLCDTGDFH